MKLKEATLSSILAAHYSDVLHQVLPLLVVMLSLTLADLHFGIRAARFRGDDIRISRAVRRTGDKIAGYLFWLFLAVSLGVAYQGPMNTKHIPHIILGIVYVVELESIFHHWLELKGYVGNINIFKFIGSKIGLPIEIKKKDEEPKL